MAEDYKSPPTDLMIRRAFEFPWTRRKRLHAWREWTSQHWDREPATNLAAQTTVKRAIEEPGADTGLLIAFEGGEGVGKSTQARLLALWLRDQGYDVVPTHEPGATKVGMRLRALLLDTADAGLSPLTEALMYAADRAEHVASVVAPALDRGAIVITDRYMDSSLAYQGAGRELPVEDIASFNRRAADGRFPDLTILLDMDPIAALQRRSRSDDRLEAEPAEFHQRVRDGFLALAREEPSRYLVLDADRPPDEITRDIQRRIHGMLRDPDQLHVAQRRARSAAPPQ